MARIPRVVAVGCPHHITQRRNFRRDIFVDDQDRQTYLDPLSEAATDAQPSIWGHCLMSNHVHWVVVPGRPFGTDPFIAELEAKLDRHLFPGKRGRRHKALQQPAASDDIHPAP